MAFINLTGHVKRSFEKVLRDAFSSEFTPAQYRYSPEKEKSQIAIYREQPRAVEKYPCILIEASSGGLDLTTLGKEELEIVRDRNGAPKQIITGGQLSVDVTMTVMADTQDDRENVVDLLAIFLRSLFRNNLAMENIAYKRIEFSGESDDTKPSGEIRFIGGIRIPDCYTEWESKLSLVGAIIKDVELDIDETEVDP